MRPLSLIRPSAWPVEPTAADSGSAGAGRGGPHQVSEAARGPGRAGGQVLVTMTVRVSGGGQRVVAGLGQDVMDLPEELARLGQRGPLAVAAILDRGVAGVVRGRGAGVGLAGLVESP